jgi:Myb-like DNA-binding domain
MFSLAEKLNGLVQQQFEPLGEVVFQGQGAQVQPAQQQQQQQQMVPAQVSASAIPVPDIASLLQVSGGGAAAAAAGMAAAAQNITASNVATVAAAQNLAVPSHPQSPRTILTTGKRSRHRFTPQEDDAIFEGLVKHGWGHWVQIRQGYSDVFSFYGREPHDLRDRWRNMEKKDKAAVSVKLQEAKVRVERKAAAKLRAKEDAKRLLEHEEEQEWQAEEIARQRRLAQRQKAVGADASDSEDELGIKKKRKKPRQSRSQAALAARGQGPEKKPKAKPPAKRRRRQ